MAGEFEYTADDEFNPCYCRRCRKHIPGRVSDEHAGLCPACEATEREERRAAREQARLPQEQPVAPVAQAVVLQSRLGSCPQCGSANLKEFTTSSGGTPGGQELACCLGCLFFWPLLLVIPFMPRPTTQIHRRCNDCGFQWLV